MRRRYTTLTLAALDIACAVGVFNLAALVRGVGAPGEILIDALIAPIAIMMLALFLIDGYSPRIDMLSVDYASQHAIAMLAAMVATLVLTYVFVSAGYELQSSRLVISLSFLGIAALTLGYRRIIYLRRMPIRGHRGILFVGDRKSCEHFRDECLKMEMRRPVIYATSTAQDSVAPPSSDALGQLRPFDEVLAEVESGQAAVEAIVLRESARELPADLSRRLVQLYVEGAPTYTLELFHQIYWRKIPLYRLNPTWLFQEGFKIAREPVFERLKRLSDLALSLAGLVLGAPILLAAAFAVWLEDRGPPIFSQTRVGRNHVPFRLLKLRTMRAAPAAGGRYTQPDDPRITRVGRFLRVTRLDELPQLWNVLRGEMSLIGPRAEWDLLVETYEHEIPCYHFRHLVKPGITGWAQVNYPYGASLEDTIRKLEYDLYYIRHFSFLLDATIVLKTIHIVLFGKGR
jgi:exopolysaccharide biosynthesis polyprenyl glycosylphosphotransferase